MDIKIETGIPAPTRRQQDTGVTAALRSMKVGDSFVHSERGSLHQIARQIGLHLATRKQEDGSYRIWRIK